MKLKFAAFCSSFDALSDGILFLTMSNFSDFGQKPWTIIHGLIFGSPKKVLRKECHSKESKKGNLLTLVSVA